MALPENIAAGFWRRVNKTESCWLWTGKKQTDGYGQYTPTMDGIRRFWSAHRVAYELMVGPIPNGLQVDHLCRVRLCVNPDHLEAVTQTENVLRGVSFAAVNADKTHCSRGHEFTPENTYRRPSGNRDCRACLRLRWRKSNQNRAARKAAA